MPNNEREPSGLTSMATPSWYPSCAISAELACRPPTTQPYVAGV